MTDELTNQEQSLRQDVAASEEMLEGLESDLLEVNAELTELAGKNHQYELLGQICHSLDELEKLDAGELFWNSPRDIETRRSQLDGARNRIEAYAADIERVESRREELLAQIGDQNRELDTLHYELVDVMEREESRRNEWVVERDASELPVHTQVMPWTRRTEEDRRFRQSLGSSLAVSLVLAILLGSIAIPIVEREQEIELPERVARLVHERIKPPEPQPQPIFEELEPEPEKPEELVEEIPEDPVPQVAQEQAVADEVDVREQVKSKGILAFSSSFSAQANLRPSAQIGSQANFRNSGEDAVGRPSRSMVTTNAPGSSGGINLSNISRDFGGGGQQMGGVEVSRVASSIGNGGTGNSDRPLAGGAVGGRTDEEIQIVFDRHKAALYRLYNRELRKNPTLRGQVILKLTIEPDGSVSYCILQSSDMGAPALAQQVVERVITFDFGAKEDISAVTIIYPIDFLPAA